MNRTSVDNLLAVRRRLHEPQNVRTLTCELLDIIDILTTEALRDSLGEPADPDAWPASSTSEPAVAPDRDGIISA